MTSFLKIPTSPNLIVNICILNFPGVLEQKCESCGKNVEQIINLSGKTLCDQCVADQNRITNRNELTKSVLKRKIQVVAGLSRNRIPIVKLERVKIPEELSSNNMDGDEVIDVSDNNSIISEEVMIVDINNDNQENQSSENFREIKELKPKIEKVNAANTDNEIKSEPVESNADLVYSGKENLLTKANQIKKENLNEDSALSSAQQMINDYESKQEIFKIKNSSAKDLLSDGEPSKQQQMNINVIKTEPPGYLEMDNNLKSEAIEILQSWMQDHHGQSPSKEEKEILANKTSLSVTQVFNDMI